MPDVPYPDARAVVLNEDELQSTLFHCYLDICGLCIQTEDLKQILVSHFVSHAAVDILESFPLAGAVCVPYIQVQICFNNEQLVPTFMFNIDIFKHTTALCHFSII